jgi:hypothetical protein
MPAKFTHRPPQAHGAFIADLACGGCSVPKTRLLVVALLLVVPWVQAATPNLEFDHVWIVVHPDAPERAALERAGFRISPQVNHHDGQGTSSITAEFQNAYIELMWPDPKVSIAPGRQAVVDKFRNRMLWRTSGWCPIGIGLHRISAGSDPFPFPTWTVQMPWMPADSGIEILTARDDTKSPSLFVEPRTLAVDEAKNTATMQNNSPDAAVFQNRLGVQRITGVLLVSPGTYQPVPALTYLEKFGVVSVQPGKEWLLEITFDGGKQEKSKDLRPDLPLMIRY